MSVEVPQLNSTRVRSGERATPTGEVDAAVRGVGLASAYQPIVSLPDGKVVGFEALARWPQSNGLNPQVVFAHAAATGRVEELDQLCIDTAITGALEHRLGPDPLLCINSEPASRMTSSSRSTALRRGHGELRVMFELTERSLLTHPHALLAKVAALRADGFTIALDDVGTHPDSTALLDVLRPDVVKLDLGLVQSQPDDDKARTLSAVLAHHERTGAVILAEGIETDEHLEQALTLGATLGQGYKFGRPGRLDEHPVATRWSPPARKHPAWEASGLPFDLIGDRAVVRTGRKQTLTAFSRHVESFARNAADPPILLAALQRAQHFTGRTRRDYRDVAHRSPLVAVFGRDVPTELAPGVRGVALQPNDELAREWTVVALGPHTAAALIARERPDDVDHDRRDGHRRFDFILTYDRDLITAAARHLLARIP